MPVLSFESVQSWAAWLAKNHEQSGPIWLKYAKKDSGISSVTYTEALDEALCWGWIDGQVARIDEAFYRQRWGKRRPRSRWSKVNCGKVEKLILEGRMQSAGLVEIEAAKSDGRWAAAYDSPRTITEPPDFLEALEASPSAEEFYATISRQLRYFILYRIHDAKRPETRARRIAEFTECLTERRDPKGFR